MRSDDILAAIFPAQVACQDNAPAGADIDPPDHPLVFETVRDCLTEALDVEGLQGVLVAIETGEIQVYARDTPQPSVFSHQILNAMPYAFLDDAPLEERRSRAVALRRALPEDSRDLGALDSEAVRTAAQDAWPLVRDAEELHDALLTLGVLPQADVGRGRAAAPVLSEGSPERSRRTEGSVLSGVEGPKEEWEVWFHSLLEDGRARRLHLPPASISSLPALSGGSPERSRRIEVSKDDADTVTFWVATEEVSLAAAAYPDARAEPPSAHGEPARPEPSRRVEPQAQDEEKAWELEQEAAALELVRRRAECLGPFTAGEMSLALALPTAQVQAALLRLEGEGLLLRGYFRPGATDEEFCDRRILARIHQATVAGLRREVEPVPLAAFTRFLFRWQHATPATRLRGDGGLLSVVEQLQGFEAAAETWEAAILPARVADYDPAMLDRLCLSGELVWGRFARRSPNGRPPNGVTRSHRAPASRTTPLSLGLRVALFWLLEEDAEDAGTLSAAAEEVLAFLTQWGASFLPDIVVGSRRLPTEVEEALWQLVAAGRVTADGFAALRGITSGAA
jgi:ATP-dependent Lhr-like helicase